MWPISHISTKITNLVTPKAATEHELSFNKLASGLLFVKHLSQTLITQQCVIKLITIIIVNLVTLKVELFSTKASCLQGNYSNKVNH
jgi:hypothetical protein